MLLDIEGTTTPIAFVHDMLFPYARARLSAFLDDALVALLREEYRAEPPHADVPAWSPVEYASWLMDRDRKSTGLKSLQGKIWDHGYRTGELRGEVYPDVSPALARWRREGRDIAIFSSGSVQAQRDLFTNSVAGDLSPFLRAYFDTTTGPKRDPASYGRIAAALGRAPGEVRFISDVTEELDAAQRAGMRTALCVRSGTAVSTNEHPVVGTFDEIV